jgi:hypothetical protein
MKKVDQAVKIGVYMPDHGRHHVFSRGQSPEFYKVSDLRDKGPGQTDWVLEFERILVGLYLILEGPVPYAFRTPDGKVRSLDAGCMKMLSNRAVPGIDFIEDADGYIDAVVPTAALLDRHSALRSHLKKRILEATSTD